MRSSALALVVVLAAAGACTPPSSGVSDATREALVAEIRAVTDSLAEAMNAHDPDRFQELFDLDARFVFGSCAEFLEGGEEFAGITRAYHMAKKDVVVDVQLVSVRILGPDAAVAGLQALSSDPAASNPVLTTNVLAKRPDGGWRIVYQHQSWPGCPPPKAPHPMTSGVDEGEQEAVADTVG
jgi:uncharacterized protein (TIGR02246 family)